MKVLLIAALYMEALAHGKSASASLPRETFDIRGQDKRNARQKSIYYKILHSSYSLQEFVIIRGLQLRWNEWGFYSKVHVLQFDTREALRNTQNFSVTSSLPSLRCWRQEAATQWPFLWSTPNLVCQVALATLLWVFCPSVSHTWHCYVLYVKWV